MSRKRKPLPLLENVTIEAVAAEGKCVAHVGEVVVFVPFVVPGDVVDLRVRKKRRSYCEATVERFIKKSDVRTEPMCPHFGICGGCKWQTLPYEKQLEAKQQQVYDQLTRIGHVQLPQITPILGSQQTRAYRNKLEFGCSDKRWYTAEDLARLPEGVGLGEPAIGFHITGAFDKIYPITDCQLMDPLQNELRNDIFDWAVAHDLSFFDTHKRTGLLRNLMVRNSNTGEWMFVIQFCIFPEGGAGDHYDPVAAAADDKLFETEDGRKALALMEHITERFPQISSLLYVNNTKGNDTIGDLPLRNFHGTDFIYELMEDLRFKVGPKSFYQTNTEQAYHLYEVARRFACLTGEELVYDLYTGTGTIANFVAKGAREVIGIEYVPEAIVDAKENARINGLENTKFFAGDMKDILTDDFIARHGHPDVIITDPPRAGMHPDVVSVILNAAPQRIVYVSCNPATQARDLSLLDADYEVAQVQPVDMFPHTPHVENVVQLLRRS